MTIKKAGLDLRHLVFLVAHRTLYIELEVVGENSCSYHVHNCPVVSDWRYDLPLHVLVRASTKMEEGRTRTNLTLLVPAPALMKYEKECAAAAAAACR